MNSKKPEQENIQPVQPDGQPEMNMCVHESGGERQQRHHHEKEDRNPVEVAIAFFKPVVLRRMSCPENAQGHETGKITDQGGSDGMQGGKQVAFCVNGIAYRHSYIQYQQGHGNGKHAIAQGLDTLYFLAGEQVIGERVVLHLSGQGLACRAKIPIFSGTAFKRHST